MCHMVFETVGSDFNATYKIQFNNIFMYIRMKILIKTE